MSATENATTLACEKETTNGDRNGSCVLHIRCGTRCLADPRKPAPGLEPFTSCAGQYVLCTCFLCGDCVEAEEQKVRVQIAISENAIACHNDIGLVRRFSRHRFCSDVHERMYLAELEKIALTRLQNARIPAQHASPIPEDVFLEVPTSKADNNEQALSLIPRPSPA